MDVNWKRLYAEPRNLLRFKMKLLQLASLLGALALAAPAVAQTTEINEQFRNAGFSWSRNGSMLIKWRPVIVDGNIAICGAYASRGGSTIANLNRQAVRDMWIKRNGSSFMRDISFFAVQGTRAYGRRLQGDLANCRVTSTPGTPESLSEFSFGFEPGRYRRD